MESSNWGNPFYVVHPAQLKDRSLSSQKIVIIPKILTRKDYGAIIGKLAKLDLDIVLFIEKREANPSFNIKDLKSFSQQLKAQIDVVREQMSHLQALKKTEDYLENEQLSKHYTKLPTHCASVEKKWEKAKHRLMVFTYYFVEVNAIVDKMNGDEYDGKTAGSTPDKTAGDSTSLAGRGNVSSPASSPSQSSHASSPAKSSPARSSPAKSTPSPARSGGISPAGSPSQP